MTLSRHLMVLAAMHEEMAALRNALAEYPYIEKEGSSLFKLNYRTYELFSRQVTLVQTGMGPVNAALSLLAVLDSMQSATRELPVDAILLLGVGGALHTDLNIGDLVVAHRILQHDSCSSLDFGAVHMVPGVLILNRDDASNHDPRAVCDEGLFKIMMTSLPKAVPGTLISGSEFVGTVARKKELALLAEDACLVDMEGAGIAQLATRIGIPFIVAKTVADRLKPEGTIESDFRSCLNFAAGNAAQALQALLGSLNSGK